jgi:PhoH-like ATPase
MVDMLELDVSPELVTLLYKDKSLGVEALQTKTHPNQYLVIVSAEHRIPCKVSKDGMSITPLKRKMEAKRIKPRTGNDEQLMALDALLDDSIPVVVLTGRAGTGKTLLALAAALQKIEDGKYDRIVLTKPMVQVGEQFGILPGEMKEKFLPYLGNYTSNLEEIFGQQVSDPTHIGMELMPIQFIRGISWSHKFVIADEIQTMSHHEILTLGTRVGQGTKLVIMGDLKQRDKEIAIVDTGLHRLLTHKAFEDSPLTASVNLTKVERSAVTELFTDIFE